MLKLECLLLVASVIGCIFGKRNLPTYSPAPFYNTGENLSYENCGVWDKSGDKRKPPWRVIIRDQERGCYAGFIISNKIIITDNRISIPPDSRCYLANMRQKTMNREVDAFLGKCNAKNTRSKCQSVGNKGLTVKVLELIEMTEVPDLLIWKTEKISFNKFYSPLCLFNRDSSLEPGSKYIGGTTNLESFYKGKVRRLKFCLNIAEMFPDRICTDIPGKNTPYLMNLYNERYFLRGYGSAGLNGTTASRSVYKDILTIVHELVKHAPGLAVLPKIPTPPSPTKKNDQQFKDAENLSFPNCGVKHSRQIKVRRHLLSSLDDFMDSVEDIFFKKYMPPALAANADIAEPNSHPWHVELKYFAANATELCAGTLISKKAVLTAAHCIYKRDLAEMVITAGLHDLSVENDPADEIQSKNPSRVIIHPEYSHHDNENDIAILIFEDEFQFNPKVQPMCLWNGNLDINAIVGTPAAAVGWGKTENYELSNELRKAVLPIISHKECYLIDRRYFTKFLRPGKNFCAGNRNGTTVCNGDSGGGLFIETNDRWFIRGIVSFGPTKPNQQDDKNGKVCKLYSYTIFVDVAYYMEWIVQNAPGLSFGN